MNAQVSNWLAEQFGDDTDLIQAVYDEYLQACATKLEEGRRARAAEDYPLLDRIAHTLKGNALMVGDKPSADAAISLRDASRISDGAAADVALAQLVALDAQNRS